ncbi:cation:proton antiporter [Fluoribacter dumoffii]|uniref:NhaP-type Na+/H+ and K+/H+ antiporters n=1 Tax=Fluoribacter dumoffii TaxID=463 RepID=A0A377GB02_9GAMM|nr:cation:proton antiporter [Fluoribacter dumoffii]KTC93506.1 putative Na+/H+ antiporter [Fluoribacter dumoffii NY 23]MCW8385704.1 cation:proton antiporter [Fluoribacter dumoffii]MCW8418734.1 cation:proton antiporter [Fluoribacter dumoffii]MCW8453422.1 cation:proton antiporter [Fluoribacter dumoffii]MCW8459358.1 cation:proton antiporter [Fluoribacter dumoffii]
MPPFWTIITDLAWPIALVIAWIFGEIGFRWAKLPHISVYAMIGFMLAPTQIGLLPKIENPSILFLANIGFGLILFESGYRINLRWFFNNLWILVTSFAEATLTFVFIYLVAIYYGLNQSTSLLLAALSTATSPATIIRMIHEQHSSGQVTERILHLSVLNCIFAVFLFKVIIGLVIFRNSGDLWQAISGSLIVLLLSTGLGMLFGVVLPTLLKTFKSTYSDNTLAFSIAIILLVAITHYFKLSPVLATLTFGIVSRHGRIVFNSSQRGFGTLGDLLTVLLFVFIAAKIDWELVKHGWVLGLAIILVRQVAKMGGISLFAYFSGISLKKGLLTGVAMAPISVFVILILEQSRYIGLNLVETLAPLAMVAFSLEIIGPLMVQYSFYFAKEIPTTKER